MKVDRVFFEEVGRCEIAATPEPPHKQPTLFPIFHWLRDPKVALLCMHSRRIWIAEVITRLIPAARNGRPPCLSGSGIDVWSTSIDLMAGGGNVPCTIDRFTPAFSNMVSCTADMSSVKYRIDQCPPARVPKNPV